MCENTEIWNLNALCRCCHKDGYFKSLHETYFYEDQVEDYAQMLKDTFDLEIQKPSLEVSHTICEMCILKLRDAALFKQQVLTCETKFEVYCKNELGSIGIINVKEEDRDNDYNVDFTNDLEVEVETDIPEQFTKKEENDSNGEFPVTIKNIKCEASELTDGKTDIIPPSEINTDGKEKKPAKKRIRKKIKTEKKPSNYDLSLEVHVKTESGTIFSCKICGGSYDQHKDIKKHIVIDHNGRYKCHYCDKRFNSVSVRSIHLKSHVGEVFTCSFCQKNLSTKYLLKIHENTHTKEEIFKCDHCLKEFAYKQSLKVHMRGHYGTKKKCICHLCGHGFNDKSNLAAHVTTVHEKKRPFACEICPKTFTAKKHLTVHIRQHNGDTPFGCEVCGEKFLTVSILNRHRQVKHNNMACSPRYVCKVCRRRWVDKKLFIKHLRKAHIGQRPYKCNICDKDFVCKYSMKRHVSSHTGIKPFACEVCGSKFVQKGALNRHLLRKHSAQNNVVNLEKCDVCNKNFADLKKHMVCHENKRFPCEYCGKSYSENNVLTRHKRVVHFGIKPHVCEFCDKKYVKINSLRNHQMKVHKIVSKVENDKDFDSAVVKFSIKNKKGKIKTEDLTIDALPFT